ncbi:hypothetical protein [Bradyrhizobium sp. JYMT SZCCT0428]|uniref:hypothetical protein n=1 Tax=Bradyrhizobium sp. JYMT SZCCT0428 TaxID=2807673 RepID=UPI001BAB338F|nr:hypothetical protein [Bradyrhizobium sp. JYMT SZCCT0428]MBR1150130.1 hypothetical protein [Bradyrhizobium sp. JYMT SZCCT0428]
MKRSAFVLMALLCPAGALAQAPVKAPAVAAQPPKEIKLPVERAISLQIGETRLFEFGASVIRVDISPDNIVEAKSVDVGTPGQPAFAFKGTAMGRVIVVARAQDGSEVNRLQFVIGGRQVRIYRPDEPDFFRVNCDEFACGQGTSSKRTPSSIVTRTPTGGGGFIDRSYTRD